MISFIIDIIGFYVFGGTLREAYSLFFETIDSLI